MRFHRTCWMAAVLLGAWPHCALAAQPAEASPREQSTAQALPPHLPLRRDASVPAEPRAWTSTAALLAVTGAAGAWVLWRRGRARSAPVRLGTGRVQRLSSQALTPQASVHAVQWNGEEILLACTAQQVTVLGRRPVPPQEGEAS